MKKRKNNKKNRVLKVIISSIFKIITIEWFWVLIIEKTKEIL